MAPSPASLPAIAGTPSGLLVSRSATRGTRVFRLRRDDELLRLMLLGGCRCRCRWLERAAQWLGGLAGARRAHTVQACCRHSPVPPRALRTAVLSRLWQQHVLARQPPPPGAYGSWREHHELVRRIKEAARGAQLVATIEEAHHPAGGDPRWFLD